jgi:hypothetical protein
MNASILKLILLAAPACLSAQTPLTLRAAPVHDSLLTEILNDAEMQDLNKLGPAKEKDLSLRLYAIGHSGTCVEETEWVCSYRYVLAVSELGETRTRTVYDLGEVGQVGAIHWLPGTTADHAVLDLEVRNYPDHAVKANPKLRLQTRRVRLDVSLDTVIVTPIK